MISERFAAGCWTMATCHCTVWHGPQMVPEPQHGKDRPLLCAFMMKLHKMSSKWLPSWTRGLFWQETDRAHKLMKIPAAVLRNSKEQTNMQKQWMVGRLDTRLVSREAPSVLQATSIWSTHVPSRQRRPNQSHLRQLESLGSPCGLSMEKFFKGLDSCYCSSNFSLIYSPL